MSEKNKELLYTVLLAACFSEIAVYFMSKYAFPAAFAYLSGVVTAILIVLLSFTLDKNQKKHV